jgi:hypothetical protein
MRQALRLIPAARPHPLDGKPVLESAPLRRGYRRSALSRFEDSTWDLSPAVFRENARQSQNTVHFDGIEDAGIPIPLAPPASRKTPLDQRHDTSSGETQPRQLSC